MPGKRIFSQFSLRTLLIITTGAAVLLAVFGMCKRAQEQLFHDMLVGETGPVTSREDWPEPLKSIVAEASRLNLDPSTIQVHCLCRGMDLEFVWRMQASPGLFEQIKERWKLTEVTKPDWPILQGRSSISGERTPSWWSAKDDGQTAFFVCPQTLAGEKGDRFLVAFDKRRDIIFVRYWFNF